MRAWEAATREVLPLESGLYGSRYWFACATRDPPNYDPQMFAGEAFARSTSPCFPGYPYPGASLLLLRVVEFSVSIEGTEPFFLRVARDYGFAIHLSLAGY